jgi:hypothetical protein
VKEISKFDGVQLEALSARNFSSFSYHVTSNI